ncbi:hypothetical protein [Streptomyces liliifuscus]|uniref:Uncharacterized protein n=1 Tax=Streptomyces liliifuscus TaxID=2797636 RepID=A0A7T7I710_9ACTN|nr:hypothetical protein [Streptomyces liliifuscus]QQM41967.1 hypothetical protein JEQ17_22665 [Streptomyces liliifuscus]
MTETCPVPAAAAHVPSDLAVAIRVAQKMLATYGVVDSGDIFAYAQAHGGLVEALRIVLRAVGSEPCQPVAPLPEKTNQDEAVRRSVDAQFPVVAAFLADERGGQ